ncbi:MAG: hypothetical protein HYS44_03110 [Candidatus Niyogibacteria bacterium]|nr:hypothetical protein [Candidatus Niyogibacteria bacterium]
MPDDGLEKLGERLYRPGEKFERRFEEPEFKYEAEEVKPSWEGGGEKPGPWRPKLSWDMKTLLWGIIIFFAGAIVLAGIYLFSGFGGVSGRNIAISISAPESAGGGELVRWDVTVQNRNDVALENATLSFYYPAGSRPASGPASAGVPVERRTQDGIPAGGAVRETFSAFVYGAEGFEGDARATLEYRTQGSNAIFEKSETKKIRIERAPVGVSVKMPAEANAGRPVTIEVRYVSNAETVLNNLTLELVYPEGFKFTSASPEPAEGIARWRIGDLARGEERKVTVIGTFEGADAIEQVIQARVGVAEGAAFNVYGEASAKVTLRRLFLELGLRMNGVTAPVLRGGDTVSVDVEWRNNLSEAVRDATLEVSFDGAAIDERSISVGNGFYRGVDRTIVWTPSSEPQFRELAPGSSGVSRFSFRIRDATLLARDNLKNLNVELHAVMRPGSAPAALAGIDVSGRTDLSAKIETSLQFASSGLYHSGVLAGSGPLPPKVGQETVYTVVWSFANTLNDVVNIEVRAGLPPYARFTDIKAPAGEDIRFDAAKSEIVWSVSRVRAGAGIREAAREVSFQIGIIPSADQVGNAPPLLFGISAEGRDEFTSNVIRATADDLTTNLTQFDATMTSAQTKVAQ